MAERVGRLHQDAADADADTSEVLAHEKCLGPGLRCGNGVTNEKSGRGNLKES